MDRVRKCRIWDILKCKMELVDSLHFNHEENFVLAYNEHGVGGRVGVDVLLMDYTGLKDKDGKEGFLSDIAVFPNNDLAGSFEIRWVDAEACFTLMNTKDPLKRLYMSSLRHMEIIGNSTEHPELLEGSHE